MHKVTKLLETSKKELEVASTQIGQLKQELQIQQTYYENQVAQARAGVEAEQGEQFTVKDSYALMNKLEEKTRIANDLEDRLKAALAEKDTAVQMVSVLQKELKLQEEHFQNTIGTQANYYERLAEKSVNDEKQIKDLLQKLTKDQDALQKAKQSQAQSVRAVQDMGLDQVKLLQSELDRQNEYFKKEEKRYLSEILELQEEVKRARNWVRDGHEKFDEIVTYANKMKQVNQQLKRETNEYKEEIHKNDQKILQMKIESNQMSQQLQKQQNEDPFNEKRAYLPQISQKYVQA